MQRALDLRLPWQRMDELVQPDRRFQVREGLALVVEQLQVGDQAERIGHGDDARHQPDPVPGHASRVVHAFFSPQGLAGAGAALVAEVQHSGSEVSEVKLWRPAGLPQYGGPRTDDPGGGHHCCRVDFGFLVRGQVGSVARVMWLASCQSCQGDGQKFTSFQSEMGEGLKRDA